MSALLAVMGNAFPVASAIAEDTSECLMLMGKDGNYMLCGKTLTKLPSTLKKAAAAGVPPRTGYGQTKGGHGLEMAHRSGMRYGQEMGHSLGMPHRSETRYGEEMGYGSEMRRRSETRYGEEMGHVPEMHHGSEMGDGQGMGQGQEMGHTAFMSHHRH